MSFTDQEAARLREAFASLADTMPAIGSCPSPEAIWSAALGQPQPESARAVGLHAATCPACAEAWRLACELRAEEAPEAAREPARESVAQGLSRGPLGWWGLGLAAAALLAIAVLVPRWLPEKTAEAPAYRTQVEQPITSRLPRGEPLSRQRCLLRWSGPEGARYDLRVATEDLRVLARAEDLVAGEYLVPAETLAGLPAGARLVWQVEATLPDGTRLPAQTFVVELQ